MGLIQFLKDRKEYKELAQVEEMASELTEAGYHLQDGEKIELPSDLLMKYQERKLAITDTLINLEKNFRETDTKIDEHIKNKKKCSNEIKELKSKHPFLLGLPGAILSKALPIAVGVGASLLAVPALPFLAGAPVIATIAAQLGVSALSIGVSVSGILDFRKAGLLFGSVQKYYSYQREMKDYDKKINLLKTQKRKLLYQIKEKGKQEQSAEKDFEIIKSAIKTKYEKNKGNIECLKYYKENEEGIKEFAQSVGISEEILDGIERGVNNLKKGASQPFAEVSTQDFFKSLQALKKSLLELKLGNIDREELMRRIDKIKGSFEVGSGQEEPPRIEQKEPPKIEQKEMPGEEAEVKLEEPEAEEPEEEPKTEELEEEPEAEAEVEEEPEAVEEEPEVVEEEPEAEVEEEAAEEEPEAEVEEAAAEEEPEVEEEHDKKSFNREMIPPFNYQNYNLKRNVIESMLLSRRDPETFLAAVGYYQEYNTNPDRNDEISVDQAYKQMNQLFSKGNNSEYGKYANKGGQALSRVISTNEESLQDGDKWVVPFAKRYNKYLEYLEISKQAANEQEGVRTDLSQQQ